jgi:DinB superfamily
LYDGVIRVILDDATSEGTTLKHGIAEALGTLEDGDRRLRRALERLRPEDLVAPGIGGGGWSPKDLLAHMALWHEIAIRTLDECEAGTTPWIVGVFAAGGSGLNDDELAARAPWPVERAQGAYESSFDLLLGALHRLDQGTWEVPVPGTDADPQHLGELLGAVLGFDDMAFGHAFAHLEDLEAFVRSRRPAAGA